MELWLPVLDERLATLFDHLSDDDLIVRDGGADGAVDARFESIADYYENRQRAKTSDPGSYRPIEPETLYLSAKEWREVVKDRPIHLTTPYHEPESAKVIDFGVDGPRDFTPERTQNANV